MSNPTSNYSFQMPTSTDLVTDLPADFEVFGQAVDTQMKTNADAATQKATLTTKGDIYAATAGSTPARLAVGANDTVLTADSSTATGLKWAVASGGAPTQLATANLAGLGTYTFSSISGSYQTLLVVCNGSYNPNFEAHKIRINGSTSLNYGRTNVSGGSGTLGSQSGQSAFSVADENDTNILTTSYQLYFPRYSQSNIFKSYYGWTGGGGGNGNWQIGLNTASANKNAAITSLTVFIDTGTWTAGTVTLFGVN